MISFLSALTHAEYYPLKDVLYFRQKKRAFRACMIRFFFSAVFTLALLSAGLSARESVISVMLLFFLYFWPVIFQYRLFVFWKNKVKAAVFFSYLVSWSFSVSIAIAVMEITGYFRCSLYENIFIALFIAAPVLIRKPVCTITVENAVSFNKEKYEADRYLLFHRLCREGSDYEKRYGEYIERSARKYGLSRTFLRNLLLIEYINRGDPMNRLMEHMLCKTAPGYAVSQNISIGPGQIKIELIKSYLEENGLHLSDRELLRFALDPSNGIDITAFLVRKYSDEFLRNGVEMKPEFYERTLPELLPETKALSRKALFCRYITTKYLTGFEVSRLECITLNMDLLMHSDALKCIGEEDAESSSIDTFFL